MERTEFAGVYTHDGEGTIVVRYSWEQRKLGELSSSFEYGLNAAAKEYDDENKYIRITDIDDDSREFKQEDITSPDTDLSSAENYKLSEGDILLARTGASVGKSYIYKASDGLVYYAGFLIRARIKPEYNSEFVFQNTLTGDYQKFIKVTSMRSGQPGVNAQEYSQYQIMMPSKPEQDKISDCLRNLDNLITLHQRKLERRLFPGCRFFIQGHTLTWCPATKEQGVVGSEAPRSTGRIRFCSEDVVPGDERTRCCGERSTTPNRLKSDFVPKTWCPATKEQGIGGSEAPRPTGRSSILLQRRGARRRKNKALREAKHHVQPAEPPSGLKDVVPGDGRTRFCRQHYPDIKGGKYDF